MQRPRGGGVRRVQTTNQHYLQHTTPVQNKISSCLKLGTGTAGCIFTIIL